MGAAVVGVLALLLLIAALVLMSTDVQAQVSTLAVQSVPTVQPTPTVDATVTVLNKQKLLQEVKQLESQNEPDPLGWLRTNASIFLSTLVVVIGGLFGLWRWRVDRKEAQDKELENRKEAQDKELKDRQAERERRDEDQQRWLKSQDVEREKRAEERFQSVVTGLGDEKEGAQIGAAILLRTFLRPGYEQFYTQVFDLAVANLRRRGGSKVVQHQLWNAPQSPDTALPLTTLDQALTVVFKEAFPLARDWEKREPAFLDATSIQLDNAYLVGTDLKHIWGSQASLQKVDLLGADLSGAYLTRANLSGAVLIEANLTGAKLFGADLSLAVLNGANLTGANLSGTDLSGAVLIEANLTGANLNGANLRETDLRKADLSGATLFVANLSGTDLRKTDLSGATLFMANLRGTDLCKANLSGADLRGAGGLTKPQRAVYRAQGALVDEKSAPNTSQESVSTSPPVEPEGAQSPSPQETLPAPDASQSNGMPSQAVPDQEPSGESEKGGDVGRTP